MLNFHKVCPHMFSPLTLYEFVPHPLDALVANVLGDVSSRSIRGGLVCLNSAARFDKWNRTAVR